MENARQKEDGKDEQMRDALSKPFERTCHMINCAVEK